MRFRNTIALPISPRAGSNDCFIKGECKEDQISNRTRSNDRALRNATGKLSSPFYSHVRYAKIVTYHGVITEIVWANSHCFIYFDGTLENAPVNAPIEHWAVEGQSPSVMFNHGGWDENTAKVGDKLSMSGNPRKDGTPTMRLITATINGKAYQVMAR